MGAKRRYTIELPPNDDTLIQQMGDQLGVSWERAVRLFFVGAFGPGVRVISLPDTEERANDDANMDSAQT